MTLEPSFDISSRSRPTPIGSVTSDDYIIIYVDAHESTRGTYIHVEHDESKTDEWSNPIKLTFNKLDKYTIYIIIDENQTDIVYQKSCDTSIDAKKIFYKVYTQNGDRPLISTTYLTSEGIDIDEIKNMSDVPVKYSFNGIMYGLILNNQTKNIDFYSPIYPT